MPDTCVSTALEVVKALGAVGTGGAAAFASYIAYRGLNKWQDEHLGKRKSDLAEEVLCDFYQLRDVMREIRSPAGSATEGQTRQATEPESEDVKRMRDRAFVTQERYNKHADFMAKLFAKQYRMKAHFGASVDEAFDDARKAVHKVLIAGGMLLMTARDRAYGDQFEALREWEQTIWSIRDDAEDPITQAIETSIGLIEKTCRPTLERKP